MANLSFTASPSGHRIAYHKTEGAPDSGGPAVLFCGGFMSDMTGSKATTLEGWAAREGRAFVRFDYSGHGASEGAFRDGTVGAWLADALHVLDTLLAGPTILVGSSMGGWIACLIARARPERVAGLIGIAAAPDFTDRLWHRELDDTARKAILDYGFVELFSEYGPDPYVFTKALFDDGRTHFVMDSSLRIDAPVRLIQGTADPDVPWETAKDLACHMQASGSADVEAVIVPAGDHRLSTEADLARLVRVVEEVSAR